MNRDSGLLYLAFGIAIIGYLTTAAKPPTQWGYPEWLQAASFLLAWISGKLATSPLKGENDKATVKPR